MSGCNAAYCGEPFGHCVLGDFDHCKPAQREKKKISVRYEKIKDHDCNDATMTEETESGIYGQIKHYFL